VGWLFDSSVPFRYKGVSARVYADGNNAAWICPSCGGPILFVYQRGRVGSGPATPSVCKTKTCNRSYYLDPPYGFQPEPVRGQSATPADVMDIV
jgi:hypothetical protein